MSEKAEVRADAGTPSADGPRNGRCGSRASQGLRVAGLSLLAACGSQGQAGRSASEPVSQVSELAQESEPDSHTDSGVPPEPSFSGCLQATPGELVARVAAKKLDEISGLSVSRSQPGVLWVHNDSGDGARIFAIDTQGALLLEVALQGAESEDYEDIAIGLGPKAGKSYLYIGDIGDNAGRRPSVQIYRIEEPNLTEVQGKKTAVRVHRLDVQYEDGPKDAETLMSDPRSGDLYIVAKAAFLQLTRKVPVYRVLAADLGKTAAQAEKIAEIPVGPATAGDILPDGSGIAVRNYMRLWFWPRAREQSVAEALRGKPCKLPLADMGEQGEAFGFRGDGRGYFTASEGTARPIYFHGFRP